MKWIRLSYFVWNTLFLKTTYKELNKVINIERIKDGKKVVEFLEEEKKLQ